MDDSPSSSRSKPQGLFVTVDELKYSFQPLHGPQDRPHLFKYHLTIHNHSAGSITILARKWVLSYENGEVDVIEGDKVIGKTPILEVGQSFSYASFHLVGANASVNGAFHGVDADGKPVAVPIPYFVLEIPEEPKCR